jgi:hypothetical protein
LCGNLSGSGRCPKTGEIGARCLGITTGAAPVHQRRPKPSHGCRNAVRGGVLCVALTTPETALTSFSWVRCAGCKVRSAWCQNVRRADLKGRLGERSGCNRTTASLYNSAVPFLPDSLNTDRIGAAFSLPFPRRTSAAQQRKTDIGKPNGTVSSAPRPERENPTTATKNGGWDRGRIHTPVTIPRFSFPFRRFLPHGGAAYP